MKKLLIIIFSLLIPTLVFAAETQTNVSGSNTSIEGVQVLQQVIHLIQI